ncbi:hypothetical protein Agub_g5223 [Astrephomene gubernaculifera]|uniref:TLC domain-containing protein n=1 Tax=Astrephomene gubernaculifera TaxID=47775 RepID=A0AAD3DNY5_9CHLO|nr:hypothetical protein Agub_g5223 [Astrephomene gubernaculifera]
MDILQDVYQGLERIADSMAASASPFLDMAGPKGSFTRVYAGVVLSGLSFWLLELIFLALLKPLLIRVYQDHAAEKGNVKAQLRKAKGTATLTVARLVGTVHNSIQVPVGLMILADPRFLGDRINTITNLSCAMCYISAGYFFHDLVMCIKRFSLEGPLYTTHALACHIAYTFGIYSGFLHYHGAAFLMWEISTPFVHARWVMYKAGLANTTAYLINGLCMLFAFFGCRIAWGYYESYHLVYDVVSERYREGSTFPLTGTVAYCIIAVVMNCLNTHWFLKMASAAVALFIKGKKGSEVGSHKDE